MTRLLAIFLLLTGSALAQTQPEPQNPPKPKPGTIVPRPDSGRIVSEPTPAPTATVTATGVLTGQPIERFEAVGNTTVASDTIRVYLGIVPGEPYNPDLIQKNFLNLWQTGLFDDIRIEADKGEHGVIVRVAVKERPRIGSVEYRGNKELNAAKLDEDLENVKNYYQDFGYTSVSFGEPQITNITKGKRQRVKIVIPVKEGTVHTFGDVNVAGNTVFTSNQIVGNFPLKKGEIIRRKAIQNRVEAFADAYRARGYIYSYINPEYVDRENIVVDVHIQVYEGDQFRLGSLEYQGNNTTKDKVLRREIFLEEGQIMDMETFKQSLYKLGQLGYFKVTDNPDFKVNQEKKSVDITVKGTEEGKNDIQFGGGYSEGTGFFVQTQFSTRNFLGEGENLGLSFQTGNRLHFFSLSYADPWFLDTPNSLGVSIFNRTTNFPLSFGYDERSKGGSIAYGYRLHRFDSLSLVYGLEHVKSHYEFNVAPDTNGNVPIAQISDFTYSQSSIGPSYNFDSRDNPFDTN